MESTLDLSKIFGILRKNLKLLIILPIICLLISVLITFLFLDDKYQASTQVLVNQKESDSQMMAQEVQSNIQLVNTYSEIVKSPRILDEVSKELNRQYSSREITSMLTVTNQADSQVLNISVDSKSGSDSEKIANKIAKVFSNEVPDIMSVDNVSILSKAEGTATKVAPKPLVNLVIGLIVGLILALLVIFIKEMIDKRIKTEEDVENELDIPVLGSIQKFN
ncbi:Wzz/FepE/Etk N-terminal domain-containing protein [Staphylococcus saprophyticus]|uniref:Wzz/FepE/Etk N-terminal domain-containing protein n=1 Tax=Staphylococcus saprophyticus TaxID=29385 RepID=UPI000853839C|nr:Wzz/FepE/Etk N-terminal domain-containing protein [Staphylococcus saprophyticus]ASE57940.1 capsule biosynthesis protein CapA [Staphylococcus saprophyticus]MCM3120156.1 Wzz/FepE/Etk N-terminal domain-containing protein [Staphylococcus saprophyticus]MDW3878659.1 Wzz/FepE/Etk N-terminal domain-containing protein [Staphylococcus saprophyticus]MDW3921070.1 Wzz/FepE/Etk N-terminal domain-containing protein [Staphylococcus saprophyticus]MDW4019652.1 Wzz/FepE/Etk N-terminal domain-containing protei